MQEESLIESVLQGVLGELKERRLVKHWSWEFGQDHQGQDAVFVYIVMNDPPSGTLRWTRVKPIHDKVTRALRDRDPFRWPYVRVRLASEDTAAKGT